ncbi:unnamed protein product [Symbiodinium sp. CCMP2456]|nr:unnamed protein product [Symbiodinium sp. CCMP2456]
MPKGDGDYEFSEQEQDGTDALNDDTFGDASAIGDDWEPSLAQEAFQRELEQARHSPILLPARGEGLGIAPPPGLASPTRQAPAGGKQRGSKGKGGRDHPFEQDLGFALQDPERVRAALGSPPGPAAWAAKAMPKPFPGLPPSHPGLPGLPAGCGFPYPGLPGLRPPLGLGSAGLGTRPPSYGLPDPRELATLGASLANPKFPYPMTALLHEALMKDAAQQLGKARAAQGLQGVHPPAAHATPPRPAQPKVMSVTELEAQMMSAESQRQGQVRSQHHRERPVGPQAMSLSTTPPVPGLGTTPQMPLMYSRLRPQLAPESREEPSRPQPPVAVPAAPPPVPEELEPLHEEPVEDPALPPDPAPSRIFPFTRQHRDAIVAGHAEEADVQPFLQPAGRQHIGLMTTSDKELIVRIQLNQMAAIGEQTGHKLYQHRKPPEPVLDQGFLHGHPGADVPDGGTGDPMQHARPSRERLLEASLPPTSGPDKTADERGHDAAIPHSDL